MDPYRRTLGGKIYTYEFQFNGKRIRESSRTRDLATARIIMRNRQIELESGRAGLRKPAVVPLFASAAKEYVELKTPSWSEHTLSFERYNLKHLLPVFGKTLVADIEALNIAKYQSSRRKEGASNKTVNMEVGTLRAILKRSGHWARLLPDVTMLKVALSKGKVMTPEVRIAVLESCRQSRSRSLYYSVVLTAETGSRKTPVKMIRWENVDFSRRCLTWGKDKTQAGTNREVPLSATAIRAMEEWAKEFPNRRPHHFVFPSERYGGSGHKLGKTGAPVSSVLYDTDPSKPMGSIKTAWKEALSRAALLLAAATDSEVEPLRLRMHDLRHTAFTSMRNKNVPLEKIAKILGWSPSQMVRMAAIYGHFSLDDLREGVEQISGVPPELPPMFNFPDVDSGHVVEFYGS